jgi:hypothetical protein
MDLPGDQELPKKSSWTLEEVSHGDWNGKSFYSGTKINGYQEIWDIWMRTLKSIWRKCFVSLNSLSQKKPIKSFANALSVHVLVNLWARSVPIPRIHYANLEFLEGKRQLGLLSQGPFGVLRVEVKKASVWGTGKGQAFPVFSWVARWELSVTAEPTGRICTVFKSFYAWVTGFWF